MPDLPTWLGWLVLGLLAGALGGAAVACVVVFVIECVRHRGLPPGG